MNDKETEMALDKSTRELLLLDTVYVPNDPKETYFAVLMRLMGEEPPAWEDELLESVFVTDDPEATYNNVWGIIKDSFKTIGL